MLYTILAALLAAVLAVGLAELCAACKLPGWLCRIIELAALLALFVWLQKVL
jgi:hypothetical protein